MEQLAPDATTEMAVANSELTFEPLIRRLEAIGSLSDEERRALRALPATVRVLRQGEDIVRDGEETHQCCLLLEGWNYRYKLLAPGRRQIISFHLPGDIPDLQGLHLHVQDHSLAALTAAVVALIPHAAMRELTIAHPGLAALLWRDTLIDAAIFRAWIVGMGRRSAYQRIAHLFCELHSRLGAVGLATIGGCSMPMTQVELGDALGISVVHVNRTLKVLAEEKIATCKLNRLVVHDREKLTKVAEFDATYLHLKNTPLLLI